VITVAAVPESAFVAVNVTVCVPDDVKVGVQPNVPDVFEAFVVKKLPVVAGELVADRDAIVSPSGSVAVTVNEMKQPSGPKAVAGATTTGPRSTLFTVITVDAAPERKFDAVNVTV
jgi:hypothetical protein